MGSHLKSNFTPKITGDIKRGGLFNFQVQFTGASIAIHFYSKSLVSFSTVFDRVIEQHTP